MGFAEGGDEINCDRPADDLQAGKNHGEHKPNPAAVHDASRGIPIAESYKQRSRRGDEGWINNQHWRDCQGQGNAIVQSALIFEALDFALLPADFKAGGTKMLAVQFAIAQRAQKPSTTFAG